MENETQKTVGELLKEQADKTAAFLKIAFCVDGESTFHCYNRITIDEVERFSTTFKLIDSGKRGTFYVTLSKQ